MPTAELSALRAGDLVDGVFACTRKDRLIARTGTPYLALELRDRTSALPARVFRDADLLGGRFDRGDLVRVQGQVERFREELQIDVRAIERADGADPAAFLPVAYRNLDELDGFLEHLAREVHDPGYAALLEGLLADAGLRAAWRRAPCTRAGHHAYLGGLLEHTVAVATLAQETCVLHPRLNSDLLICAALVHDLGKTREFAYGAEIGLTEEGRLLGHVALGTAAARAAPARPRARAARRAAALRAHPSRRAGRARRALRLAGGARALPPERARRDRQGRARARAAVAAHSRTPQFADADPARVDDRRGDELVRHVRVEPELGAGERDAGRRDRAEAAVAHLQRQPAPVAAARPRARPRRRSSPRARPRRASARCRSRPRRRRAPGARASRPRSGRRPRPSPPPASAPNARASPASGSANVRIPQPSVASSVADSTPHAAATVSRIAPWSGCPARK